MVDPREQDVQALLPSSGLKQVIETRKPLLDRDVRMNGLELVFNEVPITVKGKLSERLQPSVTKQKSNT